MSTSPTPDQDGTPARPLRSPSLRLHRSAPLLFALACAEEAGIDQLHPELELSANGLDFGLVPVSATRRLSVEVSNRGNLALELNDLAVPEPFGTSGVPGRLAPAERATLEVYFRPTTIGARTATLEGRSNDPQRPRLALPLAGEGAVGLLDVRPGEIGLEGLPVGTVGEGRFLLSNRGPVAVQATLSTFGFDRPEHFRLTGLGRFDETQPMLIEAGAQVPLILSYAPTAEGNDDGLIVVETCGSGCGLEVQVKASAHNASLRLDPAALDFAEVPIGGRANRMITVRNEGGQPVELRAVEARGEGLTAASTAPLPQTLAPGAATFLSVDYQPNNAAELDGEVLLRSDLLGGEVLRVGVVGRGAGPLVVVQPSHLDFGTVTRPGPSQRSLLVVNQGSGPVEVRGASLGPEPNFSFGDDSAPLPARLEKGESVLLTVRYQAGTPGDFSSTVTITSSDPKNASIVVPLSVRYEERECDLVAAPREVNFGVVTGLEPVTAQAAVQNVGVRACTINGGGFRAPSSPHFSADPLPFPLTLQPGDDLDLTFTLAAGSFGTQEALYVLETADQRELRLSLFSLQGEVCNGGGGPCPCLPGEIQTYRRFDDPWVPSGVFTPAEVTPYHVYCQAGSCDPGQVQVEVGPKTFECSALPSCGGGTGLEWVEGQLSCVPCDVVVRYGGLFSGLRICAPTPNLSCGPDQVPTFLEELKEWRCEATCDNGLYDQALLNGTLVCVPC